MRPDRDAAPESTPADARFRRVVDAMPALLVSSLPDASVEFINRPWQEYTGRRLDELLGWGWTASIHPEDITRFLEVGGVAARAAGIPFEAEARVQRADGQYRWFHFRTVPVRDETGEIPRWFTAGYDIEDRKRAEDELRRREAFLAEAQRLSHAGSFGWNPSTGELLWSDETFRVFQCERTTTPTVDFVLSRVHPEDRDAVREHLDRASRSGEGFDLEHRLRMPDGSSKYVHVVTHPLNNASGNREFVGSVMDVTEQHQATATVLEREGELRQILDLMPQGIVVLGPDGRRLYANKTTLDYYSVSLEEWRAAPDRHWFLHPDDRERLTSEVQLKFSSGAPHEYEGRLRRHDGTYRWFLVRNNPLRDEQGCISRWYVAGTDIEDRKQAEERLRHENVALREEIDKTSMFEEIVGTSPALGAVLARVARVAPTDSTVLIMGETGTGKELIARAIHKRSRRSARGFVSVNCASVPKDLIGSELFGHEKGAFTGALHRRMGRFELAEGGTLFLDEIGELPPETQIALLRVLQEREFERVGGNESIRADVRVITATNRDVPTAVAAGSFRKDLYYRLNVFPIEVPPLRERVADIPLLVEYFVDRYARKAGKEIRGISPKTIELFEAYAWPGNIRELQNVIERSIIVCETKEFSVDESWLSREPASGPPAAESLPERLVDHEKELVEAALSACKGRVYGKSGAAARLGIPPSTLDSKIRALRIDKARF